MSLKQLAGVACALALNSVAGGQCPLVEVAAFLGQGTQRLGRSIDISGETLALAAEEVGAGEVLIHERGTGNWGFVTSVAPVNGPVFPYFGEAVALDGDTLVAGDETASFKGAAYVFERDSGGPDSWGQVAKLQPAGLVSGDDFGSWMALEGDVLVVGSDDVNQMMQFSGQAWIFERDLGGANAWGLAKNILPPNGGLHDAFGEALAVADQRVLVGAHNWENALGDEVGAVYLYQRDFGGAGSWGEVLQLTAPNGADDDEFGDSVALSGRTAAIGAWGDDDGGFQAGAVYIYESDASGITGWTQTKKILASDASDDIRFGHSVDLDGDVLVVGAYAVDVNGVDSGAVYVFERNAGGPGAWGETAKVLASNGSWGDYFGYTVAVSGGAFVSGGWRKNNFAGSANVFEGAGGAPSSYCTAGTTASGCQATISAAGLDVSVAGSEGAKDGLIYFGTSGAQAVAWGSGSSYQCVVPPVKRTGVQAGAGTNGACDGAFQLDFAAWMSAHPAQAPSAGDEVFLQCWFRDPGNTSNQSTSLSDGLALTICP